MLVNINKLKPYKFIEDWTLQVVLVKPSEMVIDELVQTKEPNSLSIESQGFQLVEFEPICNYLTLYQRNIYGCSSLLSLLQIMAF
jgi:hypothetical protein